MFVRADQAARHVWPQPFGAADTSEKEEMQSILRTFGTFNSHDISTFPHPFPTIRGKL